MRAALRALLGAAITVSAPLAASTQPAAPGPDMIVTRATPRTVEEVAGAVKSYSENRKWLFMGEMKVKEGEVTMLKVCISAVGKVL